jgi:hypothetical protein
MIPNGIPKNLPPESCSHIDEMVDTTDMLHGDAWAITPEHLTLSASNRIYPSHPPIFNGEHFVGREPRRKKDLNCDCIIFSPPLRGHPYTAS